MCAVSSMAMMTSYANEAGAKLTLDVDGGVDVGHGRYAPREKGGRTDLSEAIP
jgi:hypothetical protein